MPEIDFEKLLRLASSPEVGKNAESFSGLLKDLEGFLKLADRSVDILDRTGAIPGILRSIGKKYGVDVETPLKTRRDESNLITPASDYHLQILTELNKVPEKELKKQFEEVAKAMKEHGKTKPDSGSPGNTKPDTT